MIMLIAVLMGNFKLFSQPIVDLYVSMVGKLCLVYLRMVSNIQLHSD